MDRDGVVMNGDILSGKLTRLLARLGTPAAATVAENVDDLWAALVDSGFAALLANLDAPVSEIAAGSVRRAVVLTSASGSSWTHPANVKDNLVYVTINASGGAGGRHSTGGGGGGGGGETLLRVPYILSGGSTAISIPAATAGRSSNGAGDDGADCSFGTLTARGGKGGKGSSVVVAGGDGGGPFGGPGSASGGGTANATSVGVRVGGGSGGKNNSGAAKGGASNAEGGASDGGSNGGGGGSRGPGGPGVTTGGSGANGSKGGGGGGCTTGTSGAGGAAEILIEYEEAP